MSTLPVATTDLTGSHEAVKGAHASGKDTKGTAFERLLEQAVSRQAASRQAASRGPDVTEGGASKETVPTSDTKARSDGKPVSTTSTRTTFTRTTSTRKGGQRAERADASFATVLVARGGLVAAPYAPTVTGIVTKTVPRPVAEGRVAPKVAPAGRNEAVRAPVEVLGGEERTAVSGAPAAEATSVRPSDAVSGKPAGHAGASSEPIARSVLGPLQNRSTKGVRAEDPSQAGPGVRAEVPSQAGPGVRAAPVTGGSRRTGRAASLRQWTVQSNDVQPGAPAQPEGRPRAATQPAAGPQQASDPLPGVAGQLVDVLSTPRQGADGSFMVTIALHPASLGAVRATVAASENRVSVQLVPSTAEGADALRLVLPDLRSALSSNGQQVQVTVRESPTSSSGNLFSARQGGGGQLPATSRRDHAAAAHVPRPARDPAPGLAPMAPRAAVPAPGPHLVDIRI